MHGGIGIHAVREALEERLKQLCVGWQTYQTRRGAYLECSALKLLSSILPGVTVHQNVEYFGPNPKRNEAAGETSKYTSTFESDGLLVIDDIALIVEAKAGSVRSCSRSGEAQELKKDLKRLVTHASAQAERLHRLILNDHGIRLRDGSWLDLSSVREVHSIAVSLEDLSGFTTTASELIARGLLAQGHVPWMVSLDDLRVVGDVIQRSSEFIAFLRRRTDLETATHYRGLDELDFFMAFTGGGLRLDDAENQTFLHFPGPEGAPVTASENDNDAAAPGLLASHTDPLHAWYRYKQGKSSERVARPELRIDPCCRRIIDALAERQEPGWLSIGATLVDQDIESQKSIIGCINDAIAQAGSGDASCVTWHVDSGPEPSRIVLVFRAVEDVSDVQAEMDELASRVSSMRRQAQTSIGAGLMFDPEEPAVLRCSCYGNRPH